MFYMICAGAGLIAGIVGMCFIAAIFANKTRRKKTRRTAAEPQKNTQKLEFSKILILLVLLTYFVGLFVGVKVVFIDISQLGVLLAYIGTPVTAAIGFYIWKAKAENIIKIKKDNPQETEGIPVDLNNIHS